MQKNLQDPDFATWEPLQLDSIHNFKSLLDSCVQMVTVQRFKRASRKSYIDFPVTTSFNIYLP